MPKRSASWSCGPSGIPHQNLSRKMSDAEEDVSERMDHSVVGSGSIPEKTTTGGSPPSLLAEKLDVPKVVERPLLTCVTDSSPNLAASSRTLLPELSGKRVVCHCLLYQPKPPRIKCCAEFVFKQSPMAVSCHAQDMVPVLGSDHSALSLHSTPVGCERCCTREG